MEYLETNTGLSQVGRVHDQSPTAVLSLQALKVILNSCLLPRFPETTLAGRLGRYLQQEIELLLSKLPINQAAETYRAGLWQEGEGWSGISADSQKFIEDIEESSRSYFPSSLKNQQVPTLPTFTWHVYEGNQRSQGMMENKI